MSVSRDERSRPRWRSASGTIVPRPRLDAVLGPPRPGVTVVTAQAGWGKTVATRDWAGRARSPVAWVALESSDDHPRRVWQRILAALGAVVTVGSHTVELLAESDGLTDGFVGALVNDLVRGQTDVTLVLDDVHQVRDVRVYERLAYLVEHAPPGLGVVLVGRERPPLPIARWRARGRAAELSEPQLAFARDEAAALLATFDDVAVGDGDVDALVAETEGWVMGLHLAALTRQASDGGRASVHVSAGVGDGVSRYLMREVVERQPPDVRAVLDATCVVESFDASLLRALTARDDAQAVLRRIEDGRLFVVALDNRRERFRYHHLFRAALLDDLRARDGARLRELHARAARWFRREGDTRLAVAHLLDAGETEEAFAVALAATPVAGISRRDSDWLDLVPPRFVAADPDRMARFAVALVQRSSFADADRWLTSAEAESRYDPTLPAEFRYRIATMRSELYALRGDAERAVRAAVSILPFDDDLVSRDIVYERLPVHLTRAHLLLDDVDAARSSIEQLASRTDLSDEAALVVVPAVRARVALAGGRLGEALALATGALRHAGIGAPNFGELDARVARALVFLERDEADRAAAELDRLLPLADDLDSVQHVTLAQLALARLACRRADVPAAHDHVRRARERSLQSGGRSLPQRVDGAEARICITLGTFESAAALTARLPEGPERALLEARLVARTDPDGARAALETLDVSNVRDRIVRELLLARVASTPASELRHRHAAEVLAEPEGFRLVFVEEREQRSRDDGTRAADMLSERELAVLRRLSGPETSAQIASALFISRNTLKTHLRSIYRKLGVASREQAVERAKREHLL